MGGKPWTSAACAICKKRKIRCDLQKPECARCVKRGIACPGYENTVFIHKTFSRSDYEKPKGKSASPSQSVTWVRPDRVPAHGMLPLQMPSGPERRVQVCSTYIMNYFPINLEGGMAVDSWHFILMEFLNLSKKSMMLEKALAAVSCIYLGKITKNDTVLRHGVTLYNQAIRILANMLRRGLVTDDVLYTTVVFQVLETIYCSNNTLAVWISHMEATDNLLSRCHERITESPVKRAICENHKLASIYTATALKRPRTKSGYLLERDSPPASPLDEIFKIYIEISSIVNEIDQIRTHSLESELSQRFQVVLAVCFAHKQKVLTWYIQKRDSLGEPPAGYPPDDPLVADFTLKCDLFGLPFRFANLDTARLYVLYWTSLLLIEILIHEMTTSIMIIESHSGDSPGHFLPSSEQFIMAEHYADQICRAIPYCLQERMGAWGTHIVVASMNHVTKPFASLRREAKFFWCQEIFQVISDRGMNLAVALGNLSLGLWKSYENQSPKSPLEMPLRDAVGPSQVQHVFIEERVADVTEVDSTEPQAAFEAEDTNFV